MNKKYFMVFLFLFLLASPTLAYDIPTGVQMGPTAEEIEQMKQNAMQQAPTGTDPSSIPTPNIPTNMGPSEDQMRTIEEQQRKGEEAEKKAAEAQLNGMKKAVPSLESGLAKMEANINKLSKNGNTIPDSVKSIIARQKEIIKTLKEATTVEQAESVNMDEFSDNMTKLGEEIGNISKLKAIKKAVISMEKGVTSFEKQAEKVKKQGVILPDDVVENLKKARTLVNTIKSAKTWDEVESAGFYEFDDVMNELNNSRQELEYLAKWPMIMKEVDKQIAKLELALKNTKTKVDSLEKKGIDTTFNYMKFEEDINNLKNFKTEAVNVMKDGKGEEAFEILENNFFDNIDNVYENQRVVEEMNGLGRFNSDFKKELANVDLRIKNLKKKKVDTKEADAKLIEVKNAAKKVNDLLQEKPQDMTMIKMAVEDFEALRKALYDIIDKIDTANDVMVWEVATKNDIKFQKINMTNDFKKMIPENPKIEEIQMENPENMDDFLKNMPTF